MRRLIACISVIVATALVLNVEFALVRIHAVGPPTLGQQADGTGVANVSTLNLASLTNGSTIVVAAMTANDADGAGSSFTANDDDASTTYSNAVGPIESPGGSSFPDMICQIAYAPNIAPSGGDLVVTMTNGAGGTVSFYAIAFELLGAKTSSPLTAVDQDNAETVVGLNHIGADSPGITTSTDTFAVVLSTSSNATGTVTVNGSFTNNAVFADDSGIMQYYSNATALTNNTITWTTSSNRQTVSCAAAFEGIASTTTPKMSLLGVGP